MRNFVKITKYAFKLSPLLVLSSLFLAIINSTLPFISLYYSGVIIDELSASESYATIMKSVYILISLVLILGFAKSFLDGLSSSEEAINYLVLSERITDKNLSLSYVEHESDRNKTMLKKAEDGSNGSGSFASFITDSLKGLLQALLSIVYAILMFNYCFTSIDSTLSESIFLFLNNPYSFLVILALVFLDVAFNMFLLAKINKLSYELYETNVEGNRMAAYIATICSDYKYAKDIRIYDLKPILLNLNDKYSDEMERSFSFFKKKIGFLRLTMFLSGTLLLIASYLYAGGKAYYGIITIGSLVIVVGAISQFTSAISSGLGALINTLTQVKYLANYFDYMEIKDQDSGDLAVPKEGVISFYHVSFKYPNSDEYALKDVTFTIERGKRLALVGPNGAGKSTIIGLVSRLLKPSEGTITLNGIDIAKYSYEDYQKFVAILFQDFSLFGFSLRENVACSSKEDMDTKRAKECLSSTGIDSEDKIKFKDGLDTLLFNYTGEGKELSGGEKQKVAIARALYKDSPYILLDEPTSALDPRSELEIYGLIDKLVKDKTAVFISHRMSSTKFCDDIIVLDKGSVIERGDHEKLMKANGLYAQMFNQQAKYYR